MQGFEGTQVLVVGGAGFVGSNLVKALLDEDVQAVLVVDNLLSAERANIPQDARVSFIEGSIADDEVLQRLKNDLDYAFHLATFHGNQNSIHDPLADHENNTLTTLKLYERLKHFDRIQKMVYSSAGCTVAEKTYDQAHATTEDEPVSLYLDSPYQISKMIGEFYSNYYFMKHQLPVVKARFQNVYGPREILGAGRWRGTPATVWRNVIPTFVYRSLKRMPLTVENGGIATRDFIYADDIVEGLMRCAALGKAGEVYNLASGVETTILDLAKLIDTMTKNPTPMDFRPKRDWDHSGKRFGSTAKAHDEIGFKAKVSLQEGLERTVAWTRQNLEFIETCIVKHAKHMPQHVAV